MKKHLTTTVRVEGKGETRAAAFSSALSQVQRTVLKSTENILLRIEPQDVQVITAEETVIHEKFLFFFLPRERRTYHVVLDITVNMTVINTEQVIFTKK